MLFNSKCITFDAFKCHATLCQVCMQMPCGAIFLSNHYYLNLSLIFCRIQQSFMPHIGPNQSWLCTIFEKGSTLIDVYIFTKQMGCLMMTLHFDRFQNYINTYKFMRTAYFVLMFAISQYCCPNIARQVFIHIV